LLENIRLAFQGIWSHKMRSFLTMLGIIIGIASLIAIVSTLKGTDEQIKKNLVGSGDNTIEIKLSQGDYDYEIGYYGAPTGVPLISESVLEDILEYEEVEGVGTYVSRYMYGVYYKNSSLEGGRILGINSTYLGTGGYAVKTGRNFTEEDYQSFKKVVIIDVDAADSLFSEENPIGKTIEIESEPFIIIGVVEKVGQFQPVINSVEDYHTYMGSSSGLLFVPINTWSVIYSYDEPQNVIIKATSTENMSKAGNKTKDLLNGNITSGDSAIQYKAADLLEQAKRLQELNATTNQQFLGIATISLLVGGIGVMNIMLVSVTERTREIGLKKALGAKKRKILIQFLTESAVLTSLGGLIGVCAGVGFSYAISRFWGMPISIYIPAIFISVAFSTLIGLIFGLLPSYKAAKLSPIDALRHE